MNIVLLILQVFLALHTVAGALWKFSNSERTMPSLAAIPHALWVSMTVPELLCAIALIVPLYYKRAAILAPIAAGLILAEMLFFSAVHLASGTAGIGPVIYWLVIAAISAFIIYGRLVTRPIRRGEFA